jgi:hypothetical protein
MDSSTAKAGEDGKNYVLVGDETPESSNATAIKDEPSQCPEIVYKVQYKDYSGDIKGTKLLDAPYKFKKPS